MPVCNEGILSELRFLLYGGKEANPRVIVDKSVANVCTERVVEIKSPVQSR